MSAEHPDRKADREHDQALEDTFPASDSPANSGITGPEEPDPAAKKPITVEQPTGTPTSDRHEGETAQGPETRVATPTKGT